MHPLPLIFLLVAQLNHALAVPLPAVIGGDYSPCSYPESPNLVPPDGQLDTKLVSLDTTSRSPCPVKVNVIMGSNPIPPLAAGALGMHTIHTILGLRKSIQVSRVAVAASPLSFDTLDAVHQLQPDLIPSLPTNHLRTLTAASARGLRSDYLQALSAQGLNAIPDEAAGGIPEGVMHDLEMGIANNGSPINRSVTEMVEAGGVEGMQGWLVDVVQRYLPHLLEM
ncbi:MAG: hypothetical protein M1829_006412 [Trizodia sp. TS-e1964]|nr:MAG: hypothetical protein M1829_006412 [Trizodia sp. TS-e1964]